MQEDISAHPPAGFGSMQRMGDAAWAKRLQEACDRAKLPPMDRGRIPALAKKAGITEASAQRYLAGDVAQPRGGTMKRLAEVLGADRIWLQHGHKTASTANAPDDRVEILTRTPEMAAMSGHIADLWRALHDLEKKVEQLTERLDRPQKATTGKQAT